MQLEPDLIYTRDGRIWTSSGITAGIDLALALALIVDNHGETVAWDTARHWSSTIAVAADNYRSLRFSS